ncbi:MAG TPA: PVC-type heme-binding CxxCH protein [Verrucomicrobiae bacterium]|nr:PVC-type heme-binding CxxCH protein [Verrucomicrobiae bacterium]
MSAVTRAGVVVLLSISLIARTAEPALSPKELPHFPPVPPVAALKTFEVKKGFHLELVAAEPNVVSPVALSFDENGRMFVVEMVDYSERREETPHLGRIRLLEDLDGDGVYEKSTIFATNLPWPTAVFCYDGGVFVAATPDILYLKDTDGDGKADVRETVFSGFAEGMDRINVQAMLNSFIWGLDNRIHGATSGNGGLIKSLRHPDSPRLDLHGRDFVIDPRTLTISSEAGGGQHGLSFDDFGRRFACNNSDHIRLFMYDDVYAARNPFVEMPPPLASIAVDGPAAEVYRISPEEPWRVIRTRWRVAGLVPGPIEGGGRASGYFTGATGTTIYRGNAYPPEFRGNAFVADCGGNLIHRKVLVPDGVGLKAQRAEDEQNVEFVASRDTWFRPVQFANAPDGTLYVIDMYREIIEHPWSLPASIKKLVDLNSGQDRGRIYRIAPDGFKQPAPPHLGQASTAELVATLANHNGWHRDTAARLLYQRQDPAAVPLLVKLFESSDFGLARIHALHALDGLNALTERLIERGLADHDEAVRQHAIKLAERLINTSAAETDLVAKLQNLAHDPAILVRYQLAFTLGGLPVRSKTEPLAVIAKQDAQDSWMRAAVLSSLAEGAGELFAQLSADAAFYSSGTAKGFLSELVALVGTRNDRQEIAGALEFIGRSATAANRFGLMRALGDGLKRGGTSTSALATPFQSAFASARAEAQDLSADEHTRIEAIQLLRLSRFADSGPLLFSLLDQPQPEAIQICAVSALNRFDDPQVGPELLKRWPTFSPRVRSEAIAALLARTDRAVALLKAVQSGDLQASTLTTAQANFLRNHRDRVVSELAGAVLGSHASGQRQAVIDAYLPALNLSGDAARGHKVYEERCISCHRLGGEGHAVGPDLVTVKNTGKEKLLVNILDPNREVRPDYVSYIVETDDGESLVGLLANETSTSVTVRQPYGKDDVVSRSHIRRMRSQGQSLMPEGLETGLDPQGLADLLQFIETADARKQ